MNAKIKTDLSIRVLSLICSRIWLDLSDMNGYLTVNETMQRNNWTTSNGRYTAKGWIYEVIIQLM